MGHSVLLGDSSGQRLGACPLALSALSSGLFPQQHSLAVEGITNFISFTNVFI